MGPAWEDRILTFDAEAVFQVPPIVRQIARDAGSKEILQMNSLLASIFDDLHESDINDMAQLLTTLTHEVGHCVDYNMGTRGRYDGLTSSPPNGRDSYRQGNRPYQGQIYVRNGVALDYPDCLNEFKAETYSRRIMETRTMCRHNEADPRCENHSIPGCNVRLQRDLFHTQAFQAIGYPRIFHYLPLARDSIMVEGVSETTSSGIRGPAGRSQERRSNRGQLSPHAQSRRPGPVGRA